MSNETKELGLKRINAWVVYDNLRSIPPKDFDSVGQLRTVINAILPAFKEQIKENAEMMNDFRAFNEKALLEKMPKEEVEKEVEKVNELWVSYNKEHGSEVVLILLDKDAVSVLSALYEKYGSKMFNKLEEFSEVDKAILELAK